MVDGLSASALVEEIADMLWRIEGNYVREGSGPGSRFEGERLLIGMHHGFPGVEAVEVEAAPDGSHAAMPEWSTVTFTKAT